MFPRVPKWLRRFFQNHHTAAGRVRPDIHLAWERGTMNATSTAGEGGGRSPRPISPQSRRALLLLTPSVLGFALARSAFLAASYGSYRGTDSGLLTALPTLTAALVAIAPLVWFANPNHRLSKRSVYRLANGSYRGTDSGLLTALPTLTAALVAIAPLVWFANPNHRLSKRSVYRLANVGSAGLIAVLIAHALLWFAHGAHPALLLGLSTVATLSYMALSFFWLRRARGAHSDVVALLVFGALIGSSVLSYGLTLLPVPAASLLMALLACLQFRCMAAARKNPLPLHVTVHGRLDGYFGSPTQAVIGSKRFLAVTALGIVILAVADGLLRGFLHVTVHGRLDGYFGSPTQAVIGSKRFLAVTALGIVILAVADGLLRGFPFGDPIPFGPATRTGYILLTVAVSVALLRGSIRGSASTMTLNAWLLMQALGAASLALYTLVPQNLAVGAMAANTLNDVLVCYKWYVTVAFMTHGPHDPYYYCIGGWIATLVPRALARAGTIVFLEDSASIPLLVAATGVLLLLCAQVVFVQLYNQAHSKPAQANALPQGLDRLLGLQDIRTFADASQAMARDEVARIQERFCRRLPGHGPRRGRAHPGTVRPLPARGRGPRPLRHGAHPVPHRRRALYHARHRARPHQAHLCQMRPALPAGHPRLQRRQRTTHKRRVPFRTLMQA